MLGSEDVRLRRAGLLWVMAAMCVITGAACSSDTTEDADAGVEGDGDGDSALVDNGETVPFTPGEPMEAEPMEWSYVHFPGTLCRDGNETGLGINPNPDSDKLVIFLEGGGACFNFLTCIGNPSSWGETSLGTPGGLLSRTGNSPFADWNMVYVPYCSGDVFTGDNTDGSAPNGDTMTGYVNVGEYLERVVPTFDSVDEVVLTGISAGGFGAAYNWLRTQDAFGETPVHLLDDSGPPLSHDHMPACWQKRLAESWGWANTIYPGCEQCDVEGGDVVVPLVEMALDRLGDGADQRFALLTNNEDGIIKTFLGYGLDDCAEYDATLLGPAYPAGRYPEGLTDLQQRTADRDNFAMFQITGGGHVLTTNDTTAIEAEGVTLEDFLISFRDGTDDFKTVVQP